MRSIASTTVLLGLVAYAEASKYGYNHVTVRKDSEIIAKNFQDVDVELLSPAFLDVQGRQPGFVDGTQGATSHDVVGSL
jgi:hypothetical protein